ncbi:het-6-heterokaryon incompatibility [Fusarium longipes]|uniref:Het-6-heterokaryon incompatibility n=1 Tax=Fusarium longipes TaxID=694270 RepID=A0A395RT57_9HYPO|nr:het-6-heterokaryon incompatibility [Fusarium longipes]
MKTPKINRHKDQPGMTITLESAPPFYAISHSWTSDTDVEVLPEREELHLGSTISTYVQRLRQLNTHTPRLEPSITYIWIDSVCINQEDSDERSAQVALMGKIYSQSLRTIICLGEVDSVSTDGAWQLIGSIYTIFRIQNPTATSLSDIILRTYDEQTHAALGLRWFSRIWVVQEVVLSPQDPIILLGEYHYAWETLGWAVAWLRRSGYMRLPYIHEQMRNIDTISNLRRARTRWPLDALMSITQIKFRASDQRDKVYALLGLAVECQDPSVVPDELKPDYNTDVTTLYQRTARFLLQRNGSLAMLTRARGLDGTETRNNRQHDLKLPSWCPDWSDFHTYNMSICTSLSWIDYSDSSSPAVLGFPKQYSASGDSKVDVIETDQSPKYESVLQLRGFTIGEVSHVHPFHICRSKDRKASNDFDMKMLSVLRLAVSLLPTQDMISWQTSFIHTMNAGQHYTNGRTVDECLADGAAWLLKLLQGPTSAVPLFAKQESSDLVVKQLLEGSCNGIPGYCESLVRNFCFDRAFIITSDGRMGIAPSNSPYIRCLEDMKRLEALLSI